MGFHVDTTGNVWLGSGTAGTTLANAIAAGPPNFYVTTTGSVVATAGTIGGNTLGSTFIQSSNYNAGTDGWRINSDGTAEFESVEIRIASSDGSSDDDIPSGAKRIDIGAVPIYDFNGNINIHPASGKSVIIHNGNPFVIKGETGSAQMKFEGAGNIGDFLFDLDFVSYSTAQSDSTRRYSNPTPFTQIREFYFENDNTVIFRANEQNADVEFFGDIGVPSGGKIYINGDDGNTGDVLKRTATGMTWGSASGASHPDSDHTSFANSSHNHTESDISNIGSHSHSNLDNYEKWILKGNGNNLNVSSDFGVEFKAGSGISLSVNTSPYEITFSHGGGTHVSSSTAVQALFPGGIRGSVTLGSGTTGRFFNGIGQSGQNYTWNTTTTFNGTPTFSGTVNVGSNIFHPTPNDGNGFIGFSSNRFNRVFASNGVSTSSDERLKENIENIPFGLDYLKSLRPVQFEWIPKYKNECTICGCTVEDGNDNCGNCWEDVTNEEGEIIDKTYCECETISVDITGNKKLWGFIAQELLETPPEPDIDIELVDYDSEEDAYNMNYPQLIAPLVKAVQELSTQISDLTARVEALEG